ncbi:MAG TPA: hypothetical protein VGL53_23250 [Bryobacteraceae bacterium]|jgi:hypothetical protein
MKTITTLMAAAMLLTGAAMADTKTPAPTTKTKTNKVKKSHKKPAAVTAATPAK